MDTAIVETFLEGGIGVFDRETVLNDWFDADAISQINWGSDPDLLVCTQIWGHPVVITSDEVTLYDIDNEDGRPPE